MKSFDRLLEHIEETVDLEHCAHVDERYKRALRFEPVDQPPLVIQCEEHPLGLTPFTFKEAFDDPARMLFNMLLTRVCPCIELRDDGPLAIRADFGTVVVASILGGQWLITEDMPPWIKAVGDLSDIEKLVENGEPDPEHGLAARVFETMRFFRDKLAGYPKCSRAIQIAMPDAQGPFDTAELLCGSAIFYHLYDQPELMGKLLALVSKTMGTYARRTKALAIDRLSPGLTCQHGYMIPGEILIRDDSIINISAEMYERLIRPHDEYVLRELGGGSIHFCGNGQHQIDALLDVESLRGLDFGEPFMMDIHEIYRKCADRKIPVTNVMVSAEDVVSGKAVEEFPTGVVFTCAVKTMAEAHEVIRKYRSQCWHQKMNPQIVRDGPVEPTEIENLRAAVGWDRSEGTYEQILRRHYAHYTVRAENGRLIAYVSILSDGVADAFLLDLLVHPECQHRGIGSQLVKKAVGDMKQAGIQCVQVTFNERLERFYAQCGFHIFKGGIIDFKNMNRDGECQ
ncbi:MAG: GNAT family N-acetyltransferase [Candidatus Latescibacteria bacterium]|nr:GNAT family N-acetyltransferase [Candidatus Latescibacterota bacterium]